MQPRSKSRSPGSSAGFTLLEVLVAILIFAILITSIYTSFDSMLFDARRFKETMRRDEMARVSLGRMVEDLSSIYVDRPPFYRPPGGSDPATAYRLVGETVAASGHTFGRLRFASLAHLPMGNSLRQGVAEIIYYVDGTDSSALALRRADHLEPYPSEVKGDPILCKGVRSLTFSFLDEKGESYENWDSDSQDLGYAMPLAVGIRIEIEDEQGPAVFETQVFLPVRREKRE